MYYAIKTAKGYLATQGEAYWFQDEPKGWALFGGEDHATAVAEAHHSAIGTKPEEGYTLIPESCIILREALETALTWMETLKRLGMTPENGALSQDIEKVRTILDETA